MRQRAERIAELERVVGELKQGGRGRWSRCGSAGTASGPGGKIAEAHRQAARHRPGPGGRRRPGCRSAPTSVDRRTTVPLPPTCPCDGLIDPTDEEPGAHLVEELIPARLEVVRYRRGRGRCRDCRAPAPRRHRAAWATALSWACAPRPRSSRPRPPSAHRRPDEELVARQGLVLSHAGIQRVLHRGARVLVPGHAQLKAAIPRASVASADESPHRVGGASGYLCWLVMTPEVVLYEENLDRPTLASPDERQSARCSVHRHDHGAGRRHDHHEAHPAAVHAHKLPLTAVGRRTRLKGAFRFHSSSLRCDAPQRRTPGSHGIHGHQHAQRRPFAGRGQEGEWNTGLSAAPETTPESN